MKKKYNPLTITVLATLPKQFVICDSGIANEDYSEDLYEWEE